MKETNSNSTCSAERAKLNPFTLTFSEDQKHLESIYIDAYHQKSIRQQRLAILLSLFAYGIFALLDVVSVPEKTTLFWTIRFAYFAPIAVLAFAFSYTRYSLAYSQAVYAFFSVAGSAGLLAIHAIASQQEFYSYRYSIVFVLLFVIYLLRLRFVYVVVTGITILLAYNVMHWQMNISPPDIHMDSNILFVFILLLGGISIYHFESLDRSQFFLYQLLEAESTKVAEANLMLEKKVAERTRELEYLSYHDQLTGLYNRRFFEKKVSHLDNPSNWPLSVIMVDVNGLKLINDSLGHAIGDELLRRIAGILNKGTGENAVVSRLGGDEFAILQPNMTRGEADNCINNMRDLAAREDIHGLETSISFGCAVKEDENEHIEVILKLAEDLMYRKKLYEGPSMRSKTIDMIIRTLYEKNKREEEHSRRVAEIAQALGEAVGMSNENLKELETIGLLHDIGKIAIDEKVLNKEGALTDIEYDHIKRHPEIGFRILNTAYEMSDMADYILCHHEYWDGNGYPKGIRGEDIPIQSRIIAVADAYDAMTSARPYREAKTRAYAVNQLEQNAGSQFDPKLVRVFIDQVLKHNETI